MTGVVFDTDPFGRRRAVFGANGGAIDHTVQNQWKLRGGYALTDWLEAEGFVAEWRNDTENENRTFMRDASGQEVWQGHVIADGIVFDVPAAALAPSTRDERHVQWGTTLRTTRDTGWNGFGSVLRVPHPRGLHAAGEHSRSGRCKRRTGHELRA